MTDLRQRLSRTRRPPRPKHGTGIGRDQLVGLAAYWREAFDWRAQERALNAFAHYRVDIDGRYAHFVHHRGRGTDPLPLILTHGWPSTFHELLPLVPLLTDPTRHGGTAAGAFDVVIPSLTGYAFSDPLGQAGDSGRIPR